jgi:hypothetical protein
MLAATPACVALAALNSNVVAQQPDSISSTVRALQKVNGEAIYTGENPPDVRALLTRLKHQLRDLIQKTLDERASAQTPARVVQTDVLAALGREGVSTGRPPGCSGEPQMPKSGAR